MAQSQDQENKGSYTTFLENHGNQVSLGISLIIILSALSMLFTHVNEQGATVDVKSVFNLTKENLYIVLPTLIFPAINLILYISMNHNTEEEKKHRNVVAGHVALIPVYIAIFVLIVLMALGISHHGPIGFMKLSQS